MTTLFHFRWEVVEREKKNEPISKRTISVNRIPNSLFITRKIDKIDRIDKIGIFDKINKNEKRH